MPLLYAAMFQVILIEPYFVPYQPTVRAAGGVPVFVPLTAVGEAGAKRAC